MLRLPKAGSARLHPAGVDMLFGGGSYRMSPEVAARLTYGLVELDRATGMYRRVQLTPVDERMTIEEARLAKGPTASSQLPGRRC